MVLLLDDDDGFREPLAFLMRAHGYRVLALAAPALTPPFNTLAAATVLVVDYQMPGEDGFSFADRFHGAYPTIPVVMVSGYIGTAIDEQLAARPYLTLQQKPVSYAQLAALLPPPLAA